MNQALTAVLAAWLMFTGEIRAEIYTNSAGEVLMGAVAGITNGVVSIRAEHGMLQAVSLKTFPSSEQERLLLAAGLPLPLPTDLCQTLEYLHERSVRAERLELAGKLNAKETEDRKRQILEQWRRCLGVALAEGRISSAVHTQWLETLAKQSQQNTVGVR